MGTLDELLGEAFGSLFGDGLAMGAAIFIFFAYVAFKCQVPTSGLVFMGILLMGVLAALGYISFLVYGIVLIVGAYWFWRGAMAVGG